MFKSYTMELGGRPLTLEFGKYAEQASGSTLVRYGDTVVLVNATVASTPRPGIDFFPLSVDLKKSCTPSAAFRAAGTAAKAVPRRRPS